MVDTSQKKAVLKAAKKILKKQSDNKPLSIDTLVERVRRKVAQKAKSKAQLTPSNVQAWLQESTKKFVVHDTAGTICLVGKGSKQQTKQDKKAKKNKRKRNDDDDEMDRTSSPNDPSQELSDTLKEEEQASKKSKKDFTSTDEWRRQHKIAVIAQDDDDDDGKTDAYPPLPTFDTCQESPLMDKQFVQHCQTRHGFIKPTPIQAQVWSVPQSSNVVGIAETGSGKTLAYTLPALTALMANNPTGKSKANYRSTCTPRMLVLAPTRELAMQIQTVLQDFASLGNLQSVLLVGGVPKPGQLQELQQCRTDAVIVATPGRLKDMMQDGVLDMSSVEQIVLDEADRMLDMGFEYDVRYILGQCRVGDKTNKDSDKQRVCMFSATWPQSIQSIAMEFMQHKPVVRVYVGMDKDMIDQTERAMSSSSSTMAMTSTAATLSANKRVEQNIFVLQDHERPQKLRELLRKHGHGGRKANNNIRIIVFALYKKEVERLERTLMSGRDTFDCCSIHGNKNQAARTEALDAFKSGKCRLLIATDVAARGLDIDDVEVVINYTFPLTVEDYVHRIGRTGRAGKTGISYTFFQQGDKAHAGALQQVLRRANQPIPEELAKFGNTIKKKAHSLYGDFGPRGHHNGVEKKATRIVF